MGGSGSLSRGSEEAEYLIRQQYVICPKRGGRVEYVNTCMKELFIVFYHRVEQY